MSRASSSSCSNGSRGCLRLSRRRLLPRRQELRQWRRLAAGEAFDIAGHEIQHALGAGLLQSEQRLDKLATLGNRSGKALADALTFSRTFDVNKYGTEGAPLHDPTVTAYLLRPELFGGRHINVEIETVSELTMGMTVADYWRVTQRPANARYMREVDVEGFFELLFERIARLP